MVTVNNLFVYFYKKITEKFTIACMHSMDYNYKDSILLFQLSLLVSHCIGSLIPHRSSRKHKPMQQSCEVSSFTSWPLVLLLGL